MNANHFLNNFGFSLLVRNETKQNQRKLLVNQFSYKYMVSF